MMPDPKVSVIMLGEGVATLALIGRGRYVFGALP